jgi:hypothetical protein
MGNWDDRSGGERWRESEQSNWNRDRDQGRDYGREQGRGAGGSDHRGGGHHGGSHDDRGFIDRAGDEVRSWFGDDEAQRRREADQRRWEQEQRMTGRRDNDERGRDDQGRGGDGGGGNEGPGTLGGGGFGTGWGNQEGRSWNRERPGERGGYGASGGEDYRAGQSSGGQSSGGQSSGGQSSGGESRGGGERHYGRGEREGWFSDSRGGERGDRFGGRGASSGSGYGGGSDAPEYLRGSGLGGDPERGRVDFGSSGSQASGGGSAPLSGGFGGDYGSAYGPGSASGGSYNRGAGTYGQSGAAGLHDPHYSEWRRRQIEDLDRDYDEYRREHQSKFENEFGTWRSKRQGQRQSLNKVSEHMEVVGSDGSHVGKVDKVRGDRIILAKSDANAGGIHHSVPCSWVEGVEDKVTLNKTAEQAMTEWRSEERSRALFEREDAGSDGPRNLDRAFSGTYGEGKRDAAKDESGERKE